MIVEKVLSTLERRALDAVAKARVPQMLVMYNGKYGEPVCYINLN